MNETTKDNVQTEIEMGKEVGKEHISFGINGEIVSSIFGFLTGINCFIPMKFYKDRVFIHLKSPDNVQYAQVEINSSDLLDYKPGLEYGNIEKNIVIDTRHIGLPCINNIIDIVKSNVVVDDGFGGFGGFHGPDEAINKYNGIVKVFVFEYKIEFRLPGNIIIWADLIKGTEMHGIMKGIEKLPAIIKKVRSDSNIKKASVTIEQFWFDRICSIRGVERCESTFKVSIDKKEGFTLIQKDIDGFYELKLKPKCLNIEYLESSKDSSSKDSSSKDSSSKDSDNGIYVCINKEYILPINLKSYGRLAPVKIEIRQDKPILIEKKLTSGIDIMLTTAPHLKEKEKDEKEDNEISKEINKVRHELMDF